MRRLSAQQVQILNFGFIIVLALIIGNLVYNLQNLPLEEPGGEVQGPSIPRIDDGSTISVLRVLTLGLGTITLVGIAALVIRRFRRREKGIRGPTVFLVRNNNYLLAVFMMILAFIVFFFLGRRDGSQLELPEDSGGGTSGGGSSGGVIPPAPTIDPDALPLGVIILVLVVALLIGLNLVRYRSLKRKPIASAARTETAEEVAQTIYSLETGTDARSAILRCYRNMSEILARHGTPNKEHLTPREFRSQAGPILGLNEGSLQRLTGLFEVARYSPHPVGEGHRREATSCLKEIQAELEE